MRADFVYREASYANELGFFAADDTTGSIAGLAPGSADYLRVAFQRAQTIFASGTSASAPDVTLRLQGKTTLIFFLVQNGTIGDLLARNPTNDPGNGPLAFFSMDRLNPDSVDHFTAFRHDSEGYTQFGFEDQTGGGDRDFDDVTYNVHARLVPISAIATRPPSAGTGYLEVVTTDRTPAFGTEGVVEFILDASGSMWQPIGRRTKIDVARAVMIRSINSLPDSTRVALRLFGHRLDAGRPGACQDSELMSPLGLVDKQALTRQIAALRPRGTTPIAYSLLRVPEDLKSHQAEKVVVLVTDGEEECGGDLTAVVTEVQKQVRVRVNFVGLAIASARVRREFDSVARLTGGRYYDATDADALLGGVAAALSAPIDVLDQTGAKVLAALVTGRRTELAAGLYTVVVRARPGPITIENVRVAPGQTTTVRLDRAGAEAKITTHLGRRNP